MNLTKEVQELYVENYKTLLREIKGLKKKNGDVHHIHELED